MRIELQGTTNSFVIPRNYFGAHNASYPNYKQLPWFGFRLFFPDFNGYSRETANLDNLVGILDNEIRILDVKAPEVIGDGSSLGDPKASYRRVAPTASNWPRSVYGLDCAAYRQDPDAAMVCLGKRSNGQLLFMTIGDSGETCDVSYDAEGVYIHYRYSRALLADWRQIDDAVWEKLHAWRVR
jgi:hypothetical protein